jgi:hypothetical protein
MNRLVLMLALPFLVSACGSGLGTSRGEIKPKAAFDLDCPASEIQVQDLGSGSFGATGCGRRISYACSVDGFGSLHQCTQSK